MRVIFNVLLCIGLVSSCLSCRDNRIREAVSEQMNRYPDLTLMDLYKSFSQAEFGAGHIVSDTTLAGRFLDYELSMPDFSKVLFEPIGADAAYYRVHLICVQKEYISRNQLFHAFLGGVYEVPAAQITKWRKTWTHISSVIEEMNLGLPDYQRDRETIDSLLQAGQYAVHHSDQFNQKYNPHYRIVRRDIFIKQLLPDLVNH